LRGNLAVNPSQRITFASAFMEDDGIMKSTRNLRHFEIMQKPFRLTELVDTLEFREIYLALNKHKVDIDVIRACKSNMARSRTC
jgi:hypothetical protein